MARSVSEVEERVEQREEGVAQVQSAAHGLLGLMTEHIGLLRLENTHTHARMHARTHARRRKGLKTE